MNEKIFELFIHLIVLFTAFPIHECAHALVAHWLGDDTAKNQGRITLNPISHLSLMGTIMMVVMGFGWAKPVPINPNNFKKPKQGMALSAFAGPISNLLLAYISIIIFKIFSYLSYGSDSMTIYYLSVAFQYMAVINLGLAVFNLLPIPPLDGSKLFNAVLPDKAYFKIMQYENIIFFALIAISFTGLLDKPLMFLQSTALNIMDILSGWVDWIMILIMR